MSNNVKAFKYTKNHRAIMNRAIKSISLEELRAENEEYVNKYFFGIMPTDESNSLESYDVEEIEDIILLKLEA